MPPTSASYPFLDWIRDTILNSSEGLITPANLFDERDIDLQKRVEKAIQSALGFCATVSLANISRTETASPDDTIHRMTCAVIIARGSLCKQDITPLAESLFMRFCAGYWKPAIDSPDVYADNYSAQVHSEGNIIYQFTVSTDLNLTSNP